VSYECEVAAVLTVIEPASLPVIGRMKWEGTARFRPGEPLVLTGRCRVHAGQLRLPSDHPLFDPDRKWPDRDLVKEITVKLELTGEAESNR
jgi:hypothetical protein